VEEPQERRSVSSEFGYSRHGGGKRQEIHNPRGGVKEMSSGGAGRVPDGKPRGYARRIDRRQDVYAGVTMQRGSARANNRREREHARMAVSKACSLVDGSKWMIGMRGRNDDQDWKTLEL
jgi:hypothetical protein